MSDNEQLHSPLKQRGSSPGQDFLIVGIGGSAGGIAALRDFFQHVSAESGMAFVVIMHLSPQHESNLAELLQVHTKIPVTQVKETVQVEPNHVYVIPPTRYLVIQDGEIRLAQPQRVRAAHTSVDVFFRTLADAYGTNVIGIILSGTGTDGTLGLRRIKEKGGFAIVQDPSEAEYDSMPRNAIDTGLVDLILPVARMADRIQSLHAMGLELHEAGAVEEQDEEPQPDMNIAEVLDLLRQRTGHDFTQYKRPTLGRRIARRLLVHGMAAIEQYAEYLREHNEEIQLLLRDLLISVTNFFRDREAYDALAREVVPRLFAGKGPAEQVRVWVVGCATGEEAYSIAMLLCEHAATLADPPRIQIFAGDIDERAIAEARDAFYPQSISLDVSPERLRRFFNKEGERYQVKKELRELIVFAPYNVLRDPPFSRLDLVSCRNLLFYLSREMQQRALATFHFALVPGGYLFLGASERAESSPMLFSPIGKKQSIFVRRAAVVAGQVGRDIPSMGGFSLKRADVPAGAVKVQVAGALHQKVVELLAPPSVLINEDYEILHSSEHAGRFMRFSGGEPSRNLLKVVLPSIRLDLQGLLLAAAARFATRVRSKEANPISESCRLNAQIEGKPRPIKLTVRHFSEDSPSAHGFFLVLFEEMRRADNHGRSADGHPDLEVVKQLEEELQRTRDQLHLTVDQYKTSTDQLKASNEELRAINEELRSTTEELETSKEELQSVNEELNALNSELRDKIDEVGRANSDLLNLMSSTDIGTIFLDRGLCIKRYTESVRELFNITDADIGRPLDHFTHKLQYAGITEDALGVLRTLQTREREVRA